MTETGEYMACNASDLTKHLLRLLQNPYDNLEEMEMISLIEFGFQTRIE